MNPTTIPGHPAADHAPAGSPTGRATDLVGTRERRAADLAARVDGAIEDLTAQLAQGHTARFRAVLAFLARFHRYSPANCLLILGQRPDATMVAGLRRWNRLGYRVRAGETAIWIWAPIVRTEVDVLTGEEGEALVGFRPAPVFAAEQLANLAERPLPEPFPALPDDADGLYRIVRDRIAAAGVRVEERALPAGVQGASQGGRIVLRAGLDSRNRLFTLLHELAHELAHQGPDGRGTSPARREFEAESAAYAVAAALGLAIPTSRDYLLSYGATAEELRGSLGTIQALVRRMLAVAVVDDGTAEAALAA